LRIICQVFALVLSALQGWTVAAVTTFKSRTSLQMESLTLRYQLAVLRRSVARPKLTSADRLWWAWLHSPSVWRFQWLISLPSTRPGPHEKSWDASRADLPGRRHLPPLRRRRHRKEPPV